MTALKKIKIDDYAKHILPMNLFDIEAVFGDFLYMPNINNIVLIWVNRQIGRYIAEFGDSAKFLETIVNS